MAENPGKATPSADSKSQDKTGPVRPPVLEGTARTAPGTESGPAAKPGTAPAGKPEPAKTAKPAASTRMAEPEPSKGSPWLAGLLGGAIGLGAAYGLAWFGLWPSPPAAPPPTDPRLAQFGTAIPQLQDNADALQGEIAALTSRISGLETNIAALPAAASETDNGLAEQVATLAAQVESLAAAPSASPASTPDPGNAEAIAALEAQLAELRQAAEDNATRIVETESRVTALAETANANRETGGLAARLPLIFSGLEGALASGRTYEPELSALRQALPDLSIPEALSASATNGLPRPDEIARRLDAAIPDMLAGRPANAQGNWQDNAMDWARNIVAMRPAGEIEGDGPDAQIARLEAALARRDFTAAQAALEALPPAMQAAAGNVAADIAALAAAEAFLADLRKAALATENGA